MRMTEREFAEAADATYEEAKRLADAARDAANREAPDGKQLTPGPRTRAMGERILKLLHDHKAVDSVRSGSGRKAAVKEDPMAHVEPVDEGGGQAPAALEAEAAQTASPATPPKADFSSLASALAKKILKP